ncbi:MAG TPA: hypothetical protein VLC91_10055 [Spongiibacteraceae bacterium]|nr:hypothetical protein [Spongiibacteraceae bacterium]
MTLLQINDSQLIASHPGTGSQSALASDPLADAFDSHTRHQKPPRFDDILDQTLAGPLFANWSPTAVIAPTAKSGATNASVAALDANGRRDGRKRSRR